MAEVRDMATVPTGAAEVLHRHRPLNGLLFVGTDTGVGKTVVRAAVAALLLRQGHPVAVCKPVATGESGPARIGCARTRCGWPKQPE